MQGIPAALYARWAAGSEFQNFPPELSRAGKTGSSPKNHPEHQYGTVRFELWAVTPGLIGGESATSANEYGGYI